MKQSQTGIRAVIFDLDGTLSDSAPAITRGLAATWTALGRTPPTLDAVRSMIGDGPEMLVVAARAAIGLEDDAKAAAVETQAFMQAYALEGHGGDPYPGALATLQAAADLGLKLAVCTNKPQAAAEKLLDGLGFSPFLSGIVGGDTAPARKPDPAHVQAALALFDGIQPHEAVLVGDGPQDVSSAEDAGVPVIIAAYGYGGAAQMRPDLPQISSISELTVLLRDRLDIVNSA